MNRTYAQRWAKPINQTYGVEAEGIREYEDPDFVLCILTRAADALRGGKPATFTGEELDIVRHLMPAHEVHQSAARRWVLDNYGAVETA